MSSANTFHPSVLATTQEVLPAFGVAFVEDENERLWGVTKSTTGPGLTTLKPGTRVRLTLSEHPGFSLVHSYQRLD